ncbi:hypothetical protein [Streptomyces sp. NPDC051572]|uniref:hypothetical protein n=1 Tax=unclassified Streptomyces TaxID=2593676 RepID=UPI00344EE210
MPAARALGGAARPISSAITQAATGTLMPEHLQKQLVRRQEPGLAAAAEEVLTAVVDHYADTDRTTRALAAFHEALRPALEPPALPRRRWTLRRRNDGS